MEWYDDLVTVVKIQKETEDTRRFFVKINSTDGSKLEFESGQFVELILPIDSDIKKCSRHYSIASQPTDDLIEFIINNVSGGVGTDYLFSDSVVEGETQWRMIAPLGRFVLPHQIKKDLCSIAKENAPAFLLAIIITTSAIFISQLLYRQKPIAQFLR